MDVNNVPKPEAPAYVPPVTNPAPAPEVVEPVVKPSAQQEKTAKDWEKNNSNGAIENLERSLSQINQSISSFQRHMQISVHHKTNRIMVKVMDTDKNEVIREIPPEKALDAFAKALELAGVFMDIKR